MQLSRGAGGGGKSGGSAEDDEGEGGHGGSRVVEEGGVCERVSTEASGIMLPDQESIVCHARFHLIADRSRRCY